MNKNITYHFNKRLSFNKKTGKSIYYQDIKKKYKFYTNLEGYNLLYSFYKELKKVLNHNLKLIENKYKNKSYEIIKQGYILYTEKIHLHKKSSKYGKGEHVTWSEDEYNHLGLQRYYLIVKSFQRFTEIWSLLERSYHAKVFYNTPNIINIACLGGGPCFECYTWNTFFSKYLPNVECNFHVFDVVERWNQYISKWDVNTSFYKWDMYKDDFFKIINNKKMDYVIISNVLVMYMTNEESYNFMKKLFDNGTYSILINSRSKEIEAKKHMLKRNILTSNLINDNDDRQIVFSKRKFNRGYFKKIFPNVPYEN